MIYNVFKMLQDEPSTNRKLQILKDHSHNELLQRVFAMTYDTVRYTYGIRKLPMIEDKEPSGLTLWQALDTLEAEFVTRQVSGSAAQDRLADVLEQLLFEEDRVVLARVIGRDAKVGLGRSQINKVWPGLITKPPYCRCAIYNDKTVSKINFPAFLQIKYDGTFNYAIVSDGNAQMISRQGEPRNLPTLAKEFSKMPDGVYVGELLLRGIENRAEANGILNSDAASTREDVYTVLWDYLTLQDFADAKSPSTYNYDMRLRRLRLATNLRNKALVLVAPTVEVSNRQEIRELVSVWMERGLEGGVLKDKNFRFKDHTSPQQLKIKLEIELDLRITGFTAGTPGTKREATFGAMTFESDDGLIRGQTSGFSDDELEHFSKYRDDYVGKIIAVKANDLSKGRDNDYYALMHPRFVEVRTDKDETDTLERALEIRAASI